MEVPVSKSVAQRAAMFAAIADGESEIVGYSEAADPQSTLSCLRQLGVHMEEREDSLFIIGAGLRTAIRTEPPFEKLLATGLTTIIGVQAFIIIGGVIKVVPLTGITLPFVSYGGSSLIANYILLALLLRVSDSSARRLGELPDEPTTAERIAAWRLRSKVRSGKVLAVDVDDVESAGQGAAT